jgi:hypothetical protein
MDLTRVLFSRTLRKLQDFTARLPCVALHLRDETGELEAVHVTRTWPDAPQFLDTLLIRAELEARACRLRYDERDFPEGEVWRAHGSTADMIDALNELPAPGQAHAPTLLIPTSSDLWIPPSPGNPPLPRRSTFG